MASAAPLAPTTQGGVVSLEVSGSTFSNNAAFAASAIDAGSVPASITNSTFYGNTAVSLTGGSLRSTVQAGCLVQHVRVEHRPHRFGRGGRWPGSLNGKRVPGQHHGGGACSSGVVDGGFNVSDETTCATAATSLPSTDAQLDPAGPADHGGPTQTIALLSGSPAIDLVPVSSGLCPATDQRGVTRPVDGDDNGIAACDAGAYEAPRPPDTTNPVVTVPGQHHHPRHQPGRRDSSPTPLRPTTTATDHSPRPAPQRPGPPSRSAPPR